MHKYVYIFVISMHIFQLICIMNGYSTIFNSATGILSLMWIYYLKLNSLFEWVYLLLKWFHVSSKNNVSYFNFFLLRGAQVNSLKWSLMSYLKTIFASVNACNNDGVVKYDIQEYSIMLVIDMILIITTLMNVINHWI